MLSCKYKTKRLGLLYETQHSAHGLTFENKMTQDIKKSYRNIQWQIFHDSRKIWSDYNIKTIIKMVIGPNDTKIITYTRHVFFYISSEDQQNLIGYNPPGNGPITPSDETNYSSNTSPVTQYLAGKESRLTNRTSRSGSKQHEEGTITGTLHTEASFKSSNLSLDLVDSLRSTSTDTKS